MSFTMMMKSRVLAVLAILLLLAGAAFAYFRLAQPETTQRHSAQEVSETQTDTQQDSKLQASYTYIATESGQLALDLLRAQAEVETESYGDAGDFVTSINGLAGSNEYYWAFYLNNEYAERGAAQTVLEEGDVIRFVYEAVQVIRLQVDPEGTIVEPETTIEGAEDASTAGQNQ